MIGKVIQNYTIVSFLGEGGMGAVYKATDIILGREVALKMLHGSLTSQSQFLERFKKEARIVAQLLHPNIAVIYNFIEQDASHYMVMEYVEGKNLDDIVRQHKTLSYKTVVPVFTQALEGLHHAHRKGIVHRDIKPSNLILTPEGTVKVMDFGIAKMAGEQRLTQVNKVVGTIEFMAPELIQGKDPSVASDIYAAGVTMYELLTGKLPFENSTDYNLMQEIMKKKPLAPDKLNVSVPKVLSNIIVKALEKKPEDRFTNARVFQQALIAAFPDLREVDINTLAPKVAPETKYIKLQSSTSSFAATQIQATRIENITKPISKIKVLQESLLSGRNKYLAAAILLFIGISIISFSVFSKKGNEITKNDPVSGDSTGIQTVVKNTGNISTGNQYNAPVENRSNLPVTPPGFKAPVESLQPAEEKNKVSNKKKDERKNTPPSENKNKEPLKKDVPQEIKKENPVQVKEPEIKPEEPVKKAPKTIRVNDRLEVSLYLREAINESTAAKGQPLSFTVTKPVYYNGEIIIEKGATATGRITKAGNKKIGIVISSVIAANGSRVSLQETELSGRIEEILSSRNYSAYLKKGIKINL